VNALNRDIRPGEVVIILAKFAPPEYQDDRRFFCIAGFGLRAVSHGRMLVGRWLKDNRPASTNALWIDVAATNTYQRGGQP